jgi:alditol oxidase
MNNKKRTFLKNASLFTAGALLTNSMISCKNNKPNVPSPTVGSKLKRTNWAGNLTYSTDNLVVPENVVGLQDIIKRTPKARPLGTAHCFNTIADSPHCQISSSNLSKYISIDKANQTVTVEAGTKYGEFCKYLDDNGFALFNLASLPHISVAGACATATHGSGIKNGCLASSAIALEMVNGEGDIIKLNKKDHTEEFNTVIVGLGAFGVVTKITLKVQPTFKMNQVVYQNLSMDVLKNNFEKIMSAGYSVSLFTDWQNENISEVWIKNKSVDGKKVEPTFFGATLATKNLHPIESLDAINCTDQMGVDGPWYERMPHFKMGFTPSSGKELQAEYFVPIENAYEAFMAVEKLNEKIFPILFITEIRAIAADDLPMSPFYKKTCLAIHFTWKQEVEPVMALLPEIEAALAPYGVRPHWGKLFTLNPKVLQSRIPGLQSFKSLAEKHDPKVRFRNEFLEKNLYS